MYCRNCGAELDSDARFCKLCGTSVGSDGNPNPGDRNVNASMFMNKKSEALALILSLLIPGLGHLYIGDLKKGVIILIAGAICMVMGFLFLIPYLVALIIWIYAMYDSYVEAKEYNKYLLEHNGETPW